MDLESARNLAKQIDTMEPSNPVEGLSPEERFTSLGNRIDALSDRSGGALGQTAGFYFDSNLHLTLKTGYTVYLDGSERPNALSSISATWSRGQQHLTKEAVAVSSLKGEDAPRILGLIEDSVAEAENYKQKTLKNNQESNVRT